MLIYTSQGFCSAKGPGDILDCKAINAESLMVKDWFFHQRPFEHEHRCTAFEYDESTPKHEQGVEDPERWRCNRSAVCINGRCISRKPSGGFNATMLYESQQEPHRSQPSHQPRISIA